MRDTDASYYPGFLAYLETATMAWPDRKPTQNLKTKNFIISIWSQKSKSMPGNRNINLEKKVKEREEAFIVVVPHDLPCRP